MTETLVRPTNPRRLGARALEIILGRLPPGRWARAIPGLEGLYARHMMSRRDHTGLHGGVYPSYEAALADIPKSRLSGWDHDNTAALWLEQIDPVRLSTYPVLFWIAQLLRDGDALVDVGGSIGLTYYGYRRLGGRMPPGSSWTVVEVSKIAGQGRQVATREQANDLHFVEQLAVVKRCDVLLAAGALHYMPQSLPGLLEGLPNLPRHIVLNKLPITSGPDCWTLQNYGPAVTPARLFNEQQFLEYFQAHGYRLRERWEVAELDIIIPFHPEHFIKHFAGFVFERN